MNKRLFTLFVIIIAFSQLSNAQNIKQISSLSWNKTSGLPYIQDYSGNYSVEAYTPISNNNYAFLSRAEKKIIIFDINTKQKINEINLQFTPTDFTYADNKYFVTDANNLYTLNTDGSIISKKFIADRIKYVEAIKVINNNIYIIDNNQITWNINSKGILENHNGVIVNNNSWAKIVKLNNNSFKLTIFNKNNEPISKTINSNNTLGTVKVLGLTNNNLIVEIQKITQEVPLLVDRYISTFSVKNLEQIASIKLPNISFTYVKHDVLVLNNSINMFITTPENAKIFKMDDTALKSASFPTELYNYTYHYNNHLLSIDDKFENPVETKSTNAAIYRSEIIDNAEPYAIYEWYCNANNIKDYDCGGVHVTTPSWVSVGNNISMPYMWGGFSSLPQFDQGITDGVSAGDSYTVGNGSGSGCAVGVDCSGFVSRAWDLPYKYGTSTLPNISTEYSSFSDLLPGDIVNYAGHHVRLVHSLNQDGSFLLIEAAASATDWRVGYNNYTTANLQASYIPRYYVDVVDDPTDTIIPTTTFTANSWETENFQVSFTDADDDAVNEKFYHVAYYNGTEWLANTDNGFLHDNFTSGINPQWIQLGSTWTNISEALNQADEVSANTNIYANVTQESGNIYLYKWRMKISGTGGNRRAGIYFMCDDATQIQRNNSYMIYFRVDQNTCQIYKAENDVIDVKTDDACTVNLDEWFDAKVIFNTTTGEIKVYKDNVLASSWIDTNPHTTGNSISLRTGEANVTYDDFAIYRSRTNTASITVGANSDVPFENENSSTPSCFVESIITDMAGNFSTIGANYINIDWTNPTLSTIADGTASDEDYTTNNTDISANWVAGVDANSDINEYFYCVGTSPFANDVIDWTSNSTNTNFTESGLLLTYDSTYYVSLMTVNGAGLNSDTICSDGNLLLTTLGINDINNIGFSIYPNPTKNTLFLEIQDSKFKIQNYNKNSVFIYDIYGKIVKQFKIQSSTFKINVADFEKGVYFIKIDNKITKFIKE